MSSLINIEGLSGSCGNRITAQNKRGFSIGYFVQSWTYFDSRGWSVSPTMSAAKKLKTAIERDYSGCLSIIDICTIVGSTTKHLHKVGNA